MKKLITTILSCLLLSIVLSGCGNPLNQKVSELTGVQRNKLAQQLNADDLKMFLSYMKRQTTVNASSQDSRDSITVKQAIDEEREWIIVEQQQKQIQDLKELERRRLANEAKLRDKFHSKETMILINKVLNYNLLSKSNVQGANGEPYVSFDLFFENKSEKDITYIAGVLTTNDETGRNIKDFAFIYEDQENPFEAKKSMNYKSRFKLNMKEANDLYLSNILFEKMKFSILINEIQFKDKSKLRMPIQE